MAWIACCALLSMVAYSFVGYAAILALLAHYRNRPLQHVNPLGAGVSVVLCVRNAAGQVRARLQNLMASEWDGDLEVWAYDDASEDGTADKIDALGCPDIHVIRGEVPVGKAVGLNRLVPRCTHSIVVFCDVRQRFEPDAILRMAEAFRDPTVVAVSGRLEIESSVSGGGQGVDLYWKLERKLREWEGRVDSVIGCTGAICAIRRDRYDPLPEDTILDDVVIPMRMALQGGRIFYEVEALAYDPQTLDPTRERIRKLRTLVGNYQMMIRYPEWAVPGHSRLWWKLISHKYLRLLVPWLLLGVAVVSGVAWQVPGMSWLLAAQGLGYGAAVLGLLMPGVKLRALTVPAGFLMLQWSCLQALFAFWSHRRDLRALWREPRKEGAL